MGCDIHSFAQKKTNDGYETLKWKWDRGPFGWRNYDVFAFLAGVGNYSGITPISEPRNLPNDFVADEFYEYNGHSASWLSVEELLNFDYGCCIGDGQKMTWREFLGDVFFEDLNKLVEIGADRVVFYFDN